MKRPSKDNYLRLALLAFASLVLVAIILAVSTHLSRIGKVAVITKYAPFAATVYLNGIKIDNNAINYLEPGKYTLTASLNHFVTNTETVVITEETKYIIGKLIAADPEGEEMMTKHQRQFLEVEGLFGQLAAAAGDEIKQKYPILSYLPINNSFYSISFAYLDDGSPKITVKAEPRLVDIAVQKLLSLKDVSLTDYDISFTIPSPFASPNPSTASNPATFINTSFPDLFSRYQLGPSHTINDYYLTTAFVYDYASDDAFSHYKIILKKDSDVWTFATIPQLLFTTKNSPNVPVNILDQANRL